MLIRLNTTDDSIRQLNEENLLLRQRNRELEEMANEKETQMQDFPSSCLGFEDEQGIRQIKVPGEPTEFKVLCDSKIAGPGWTVVLRNLGDENFNRNWTEYENGFGYLDSTFFRGLAVLHVLTQSQPHELYMVVYSKDGSEFSNHFDNILVGGESEGYRLKSIGNPKTENFIFIKNQVNAKFSTYDRNNAKTEINYAAQKQSGWWYSTGSQLRLTGWDPNAKQILMLIRPKM
ncbi:fibrinogen-like protein 1 [Drosophila santomea]|uniref:fibrinogen-like protein 1 n=1 Tax=Drosophila santomea TaxID=129105 RepID=UPI001953F5A5|nr:fibrinogen-like protein 1 [Drosophila santomea]